MSPVSPTPPPMSSGRSGACRLVARLVDEDALPAGLENVLVEGARRARFTGKAGQLFEGSFERGGEVVRLALAGLGKAESADRREALEKAGAGAHRAAT